MWRVAEPVTVATESELAQISLTCGAEPPVEAQLAVTRPPSAPTPSSLRQLGSPFYVDDDSGNHASPSSPTPSFLRQLGCPSFFFVDDDLQNMENIPVMGMSSMRGGGFEEVLSDGDGLAASTVSSATVRSKDFVDANAGLCVRRQKAVRELDFSDVNPGVCSQNSAGELDSENLKACNAPDRHVSLCGDCGSGGVRPCRSCFAVVLRSMTCSCGTEDVVPGACGTCSRGRVRNVSTPNMAYRVHCGTCSRG